MRAIAGEGEPAPLDPPDVYGLLGVARIDDGGSHTIVVGRGDPVPGFAGMLAAPHFEDLNGRGDILVEARITSDGVGTMAEGLFMLLLGALAAAGFAARRLRSRLSPARKSR